MIPDGYLMSAALLASYSAILKERLALIITLHHFYDVTGDAEAIGLPLVLSSFYDVASIVL